MLSQYQKGDNSYSNFTDVDSGQVVKAKAGSGYRGGQIIRFSIAASADADEPANLTDLSASSDSSNPVQIVASPMADTVTLGKNVKRILAKKVCGKKATVK